MDWGLIFGGAMLLMLVIVVLQVLWRLLLILLVLGPPSYAGMIAGHFLGIWFDSIALGLLMAVVVAGLLGEVACAGVRALRSAY